MKLNFLFILLLILIFSINVNSQGLKERQELENSFVLLKNENTLIPFVHLDTLKFSFFSSDNNSEILFKSLSRYSKISNKLENSNLLIISISNSSADIDFASFSKYYNIVVCVFGEENGIFQKFHKFKNIKAIIYTPYDDSLAYDYCGQLLFGAFGASGRLPKNISADFLAGAGINSIGGIRFKYTVPAELGLDSAFIFNKIDSIVNFAISIGATPGCQVFAAQNQKVFIDKSYGFHTYDSIISVKNSDLYDLASVTKIAASAPSLMKLNEEGKINLNDKLSKYWKPFRHSDERNKVLIDVLCHQAGLYPWIPFWKETLDENKNLSEKIFRSKYSKKYSLKVADNLYINKNYKRHIYAEIKNLELLKEKKYKYSDLSFYLYPQIVKKITHKDFEQFLDENFYNKLGASSLVFNPLRFYTKNEIVPTEYDTLFRNQLLLGYVHDEGASMMGGVSGHAGLFGNANDLAKLMQMFLNYGTYGDVKYIDEKILKKWTSYQFADNGNNRGIVFDKPLLKNKEKGTPSPSASDMSFGHTGFTGTFTWADPQTGLLIVFLSNRVYPTRDNKKLLNYNVRTNIHQILYDAILKKDTIE